MFINISDDFDLKKIADSGQCFRVKEMDSGWFRFITGKHVLYIRKQESSYEVSCSDEEWQQVWKSYFDLDRNYYVIRENVPDADIYMKNAADCGEGIRILNQDPWEMLISFIISQRKSIPAIKTSIEMICERYGEKLICNYDSAKDVWSASGVETSKEGAELYKAKKITDATDERLSEVIYTFPAPEVIMSNPDLLTECKLGYRLKYIIDASRRVALKEIDLEILRSLPSEELLLALKEVYGVGDKVANCIALFAYGRCELAPVDTWIRKVIDGKYEGVNPFPTYGSVAGIMQQYIFYYAQTHKDEF